VNTRDGLTYIVTIIFRVVLTIAAGKYLGWWG
jgi:hypothetical protein